MNLIEFDFQMRRITDTFDKTKSFYTKDRTDAIWRHCEALEPKDFLFIVNDFIERFRDRPTPDDFKKAANNFKRNYPKLRAVTEAEHVPECSRCGDMGYILVWYHDDPTARSMARCLCDSGRMRYRADFFIPQFEKELWPAFAWSQLPAEWFPAGGKVTPSTFMESKDVKAFLGRLRYADRFWRSLRDQHVAKGNQS